MVLSSVALIEKFIEYLRKCFSREFIVHITQKYCIGLALRKSKPKHQYAVLLIDRNNLDTIQDMRKNLKVKFIGLLIGLLDNNSFTPLPPLFELCIRNGYECGCCVLVSEQGVKAFLYGNDILIASVVGISKPVYKNDFVAVVDSTDNSVIGIGRLVVDDSEIEDKKLRGKMLDVAVEWIYDLGIAIRNEDFFYIDYVETLHCLDIV